jgi:hypothetical protein
VPKWCKFIIGILLLPACAGAVHALWLVLHETGGNDRLWVALLAGAGCWLVIYVLMPKPMWVYVFGHELTHVLWTWLFGGSVKKFKTSSSGGHVIVTKSNFIIALAPYFFPFYALLVVAVYAAGNFVWNWKPYLVWFHFFLGAAYAFHITLTWHILKSSQSDITDQGYLFSVVVIFLGNAAVLLAAVPLLTSSISLPTAFSWWAACTVQDTQWFVHAL